MGQLAQEGAKKDTDITEDTVREVALPMGLVDVKVCAVDATWSGLKLVIRKDRRSQSESLPTSCRRLSNTTTVSPTNRE